MGVVNITSDSFSDGGSYLDEDKAVAQALLLINQGADIIDLGGESTKPGAEEISLTAELDRVIPVIKKIRAVSDICISIDTYKPEVMQAAINSGASLINDIYALQQPGSLVMAAQLGVPVCLMHMQGKPKTMQDSPYYKKGLMNELFDFFTRRLQECEAVGIAKNRLLIDPGFGFGKKISDNMVLLKKINELKEFNLPILLGVSRKSTIGALLNKEVNERLIGSIAIAVYAALEGVSILRVHDADETKQALDIITAIDQAT